MQKIWQNFTKNNLKLLSNDFFNQNIALIWGLDSFINLFAHRLQDFMNWNHWRGGKVHLEWSWKKKFWWTKWNWKWLLNCFSWFFTIVLSQFWVKMTVLLLWWLPLNELTTLGYWFGCIIKLNDWYPQLCFTGKKSVKWENLTRA